MDAAEVEAAVGSSYDAPVAGWEEVKAQIVKDEERRVDLCVAIARSKEREYTQCMKDYHKGTSTLDECAQAVNQYVSWVANAYCPLKIRDYARCQRRHDFKDAANGEVCIAEKGDFLKCVESYAGLANLGLMNEIFANGLAKT
eukprot:TRINITY_DN27501_c0_g1_i1.p1 TRINITY_DN27501_c0_g1~~TRINITY_DN27501_c0_g1_i1.p1  ORF type:complete len:143 (+),score=68.01 TRINITY_DN27501_c0_g1_i1:56-484(+)